MSLLADIGWHRLTGLMPSELQKSELVWLLSPHMHPTLLARRRATMIVNRVRLFALLFAVLTPLWSIIDIIVFPSSLWMTLAVMRLMACAAFSWLLAGYRASGNLFDAYRAIAILFAIPTVFYVSSHILLGNHELHGLSAAIGSGYAFLPFVLLAGLSIFPLTLIESMAIASPILMAQAMAGYLSWETVNWPSFAAAFWLLALITGVSALAGMSQLTFMTVLVNQAIRDPLTGGFSRRSGEEVLELHFNNSGRGKQPLAIAFFDLDFFKSINDRFGHEAGDQALIVTTERITHAQRRSDMLVRWGGEEFLLIMPNTNIDQARAAVSRIRDTGFGARPDGEPMTASIGVAERNVDQAEDWKDLVDKADRRMYHAKQNGRNRFVSSDEPASS